MPALTNIRQERFCQLVKQGIPPYRAYPMAGYNAHPAAPYRLCENARVKARLAELTRSLAMKTKVTVETITADLDRIMLAAEEAKQFGAAKGAVDTKAKLHGLLVERRETGEPGAFAQSEDDVLKRVEAELGADAATQLRKALEQASESDEANRQLTSDIDEQPLPPASLSPGSDSVN